MQDFYWSLNPNAFQWAKWFENPEDRNAYKSIKVEIVSENEKRFSTILAGIIVDAEDIILKTRHNYPYKIEQAIEYMGAMYEIRAIGTRRLDVNPQAMLWVTQTNAEYYLEIYAVDR